MSLLMNWFRVMMDAGTFMYLNVLSVFFLLTLKLSITGHWGLLQAGPKFLSGTCPEVLDGVRVFLMPRSPVCAMCFPARLGLLL